MKLIKFFAHISISLLTTHAFSQSSAECFQIAENLFRNQQYQQAITLYNRIAFFDESLKPNCYHRIAVSNFHLSNYSQSEDFFEYAYQSCNEDSLSEAILYDKVMLYIFSGKYEFAQAELLSFDENHIYRNYNKYSLFQGLAALGNGEYASGQTWLDTLLSEEESVFLEELISKATKLDKRNHKSAFVMSLIVPGSGQLLFGFEEEALNSFLLNGVLIALTIYISIEYSVLDAIFAVVPWLQRYYLGGAFKALELAKTKKLDSQRQLVINTASLIRESGYSQ